ncbi:hypothetical protein [Streptomyces flaveolus]
MRNRRALTIGVAFIALGALGACRNGDGDGRAAADSSSKQQQQQQQQQQP